MYKRVKRIPTLRLFIPLQVPIMLNSEELINLNELDDFLLAKPAQTDFSNDRNPEISANPDLNNTILNEELGLNGLPASPPFTKVSSIKMYKSTPLKPRVNPPLTSDRVSTETRAAAAVKINKSDRNQTKSFLPRIKKRTKQ